jgi:heme/copper-type cytochrome/quinol oxidase subunit 3
VSEQRVLDVSALPHGTIDSRALIWWGNLGMMVIEGTVFCLAFATFIYLRMSSLDWPPSTVPKPDMLLPTINLVLLLLSGIPALYADAAARKEDLNGVRLGMALFIAMGIVFIVIRFVVIAHLGYKWSDHAFGSIVWVVIGMHLFHCIVASGENVMLLVYVFMKPATKKRFLDVRCAAVYWYFVIITWLPFFVLIFVQPWMHRKGM